ncbi:hypothetical protein CSUI_006215 [Cystoisospora suis]|uniref:Uncharacterized protein n=1 Tax=Cystoisospora suis TaxID=483139 RepID=A0A2C6KR29_9APIC|nr:hypothetical protein CSUI_006215 [Cystoisospora suis]
MYLPIYGGKVHRRPHVSFLYFPPLYRVFSLSSLFLRLHLCFVEGHPFSLRHVFLFRLNLHLDHIYLPTHIEMCIDLRKWICRYMYIGL